MISECRFNRAERDSPIHLIVHLRCFNNFFLKPIVHIWMSLICGSGWSYVYCICDENAYCVIIV